LPYVFDNLATLRLYPDASSPELAAASAADRELARVMSSYWINFARTGDPNGPGLPAWPQIDDAAKGPVLQIGDVIAPGGSLGTDKAGLYQALYQRQMQALQ
jgi:para-nitrobenzyl esterase